LDEPPPPVFTAGSGSTGPPSSSGPPLLLQALPGPARVRMSGGRPTVAPRSCLAAEGSGSPILAHEPSVDGAHLHLGPARGTLRRVRRERLQDAAGVSGACCATSAGVASDQEEARDQNDAVKRLHDRSLPVGSTAFVTADEVMPMLASWWTTEGRTAHDHCPPLHHRPRLVMTPTAPTNHACSPA
jgi:hypothetical protein